MTRDLASELAEDFVARRSKIMADADRGIQTALVGPDGAVQTIFGLSRVRRLPTPDPDPLAEVERLILDEAK